MCVRGGGVGGETGKMEECDFVNEKLIFYIEERVALRDRAGGFGLLLIPRLVMSAGRTGLCKRFLVGRFVVVG